MRGRDQVDWGSIRGSLLKGCIPGVNEENGLHQRAPSERRLIRIAIKATRQLHTANSQKAKA
ncbi:hypothetical protein YTPLAS18_12860 [Nitrospira sp.]|nr:hypothetical protein YTPLAS18_12860 [Nitrospira sp.]